ncbi:MED7 protein-domain-containing protein [Pyronema omphalodes]|nr:MED7 protein-domain-containing protein [Pyronema omphalodes]
MAANEEASSAWPDPPYFYTHFTEENLSALRAHRQLLSLGTNDPIPKETLPRDSPLQFLIPPPPATGDWWCFTDQWSVEERNVDLEYAGIDTLYEREAEGPSGAQRLVELRRLSKSLLLNFLELCGLMSLNPQLFGVKLKAIETILFNMHHLINQYRPHQARETLCMMMEEQLQRVRKETEDNWEATRRVNEALVKASAIADQVREEEMREPVEAERDKEVIKKEKARKRDAQGWRLIAESI